MNGVVKRKIKLKDKTTLKKARLIRITFSDGFWSLEKLSCDNNVESNNLAFIKCKSSLHKFFCFTSQNSNSKGSKNSEYSIDFGLTGK